jgi:hypothetical protein
MRTRALLVLLILWSTGCSTLIRPTRPSEPLQEGPSAAGFSFAGQNITVRQPGMPLTESRSWHTEVENYTARSLNTLLTTDATAPVADTVVNFDMASRAAIQIGTWKEMTVSITTRLPDGRLIRSEPLTRNIDSMAESLALTGTEIAGYALEVTASIATFIWFFEGSRSPTSPTCLVAVGALAGGLCLNVSQPGLESLVAASEETRWSDLFAEALLAHADDIRGAVGDRAVKPLDPKAKLPPPPEPPAKTPEQPPPAEKKPADPADPPPMLDPADSDPAAF